MPQMRTATLVIALVLLGPTLCLGDDISCPAAPWDYGTGSNGPQHWGNLDLDWRTCGTGLAQSPIAMQNMTGDQAMPPISVPTVDSRLTVRKTSHEIKVYSDVLGHPWMMNYGTETVKLVQFHFHVSAEHLDRSDTHPAEIHFVFQRPNGALLVLAVWIKEGSQNASLQHIIDAIPAASCAKGDTAHTARLIDFLPTNRNHYARYEGSLTTPPCSENVRWVVELEPIRATAQQIAKLKVGSSKNARPGQAVAGRTILWRQQ
jgi:carbonic anhydrase